MSGSETRLRVDTKGHLFSVSRFTFLSSTKDTLRPKVIIERQRWGLRTRSGNNGNFVCFFFCLFGFEVLQVLIRWGFVVLVFLIDNSLGYVFTIVLSFIVLMYAVTSHHHKKSFNPGFKLVSFYCWGEGGRQKGLIFTLPSYSSSFLLLYYFQITTLGERYI